MNPVNYYIKFSREI